MMRSTQWNGTIARKIPEAHYPAFLREVGAGIADGRTARLHRGFQRRLVRPESNDLDERVGAMRDLLARR